MFSHEINLNPIDFGDRVIKYHNLKKVFHVRQVTGIVIS